MPGQYKDAENLTEETAAVAREAMFELADAMEAIRDAWPRASATLGGPTFKFT